MSAARAVASAWSMTCHDNGHAVTRGAAGWLRLAAAPVFAVMALLAAVPGNAPDMLCSGMHDASPLSGMVLMYALMSAFHSAPWLTLISRRQSGARRP